MKILEKYLLRASMLLNLQASTATPPSPPPLCGFFENVSSEEGLKPRFFVTFNIIIRHIFPENFIEIPQVVQKI